MSVLFSENLTFKFCVFSKQFLSLYFLIDRHEPLTGSITSGRCTKPSEYGAEQKAKATTAFGQAVVCKTWLSKTPNLPGEKGDAMLQKQPWCQGLYSVFSGWRVCVSRWRILPLFFLILLWPWFLYLLFSCWQRTLRISECATGLGKGLHFLWFVLWDGITSERTGRSPASPPSFFQWRTSTEDCSWPIG